MKRRKKRESNAPHISSPWGDACRWDGIYKFPRNFFSSLWVSDMPFERSVSAMSWSMPLHFGIGSLITKLIKSLIAFVARSMRFGISSLNPLHCLAQDNSSGVYHFCFGCPRGLRSWIVYGKQLLMWLQWSYERIRFASKPHARTKLKEEEEEETSNR